ncbi:flagellar motor protein MotS [Alteribacter natronophilus]|uniref:flagellar motor protein MotS n=1 Tax=Alteribacter natronophilus TaxID=2583810 RepID=UPI00110D795F|nr:flagellar motor protein MotS [Alteribacter natronophilus]TMW71748.1 flagellar motor protein MotB [Alteribacter natronophilus]
MIRRRKQGNDKGAPKWMVTFSDLMTLILVFFILLFSMSIVDTQKFQALAESFQERSMFDGFPSLIPLEHPAEDREVNTDFREIERNPLEDVFAAPDTEEEEDIEELDQLLIEVREYLEENNLTEYISATRDESGVVLVLQEQMLFDSAEAEILSAGEPFLQKVGMMLEDIPNIVKVEGHTDSRPIRTDRFPSNWELSGARASSVIRFLIDESGLTPERFIAVGHGDTQPVAPNTTEENLRQNRRVVIVISDPEYDE